MHAHDGLDESGFIVARRCPKVLNTWTKGQPQIDKGNRWRQRELAMEKRILTQSFPCRILITILGICACNAWLMSKKFLTGPQSKLSFQEAMNKLAYRMMHNNYDARHTDQVPQGVSPHEPPKENSGSKTANKSAPAAASSCSSEEHIAVPLKSLPGYVEGGGGVQMNCVVCDAKTTFACAICSAFPYIMVVHPPTVTNHGNVIKHSCLTTHRRCPSKHDRRVVKGKRKRDDE